MVSKNLVITIFFTICVSVILGCGTSKVDVFIPTTGSGGGGGGPAPSADYGEAPDGGLTNYPAPFAQVGNFPTLFANNGARVLNLDGAVIGTTVSAELDADDPADPDGATNFEQANAQTECDAAKVLSTILHSIPPQTRIGFPVSVPEGNTGGTYFANVLIDLNMDGQWSGGAEWVVKNKEISLVPGQQLFVNSDFFTMTNGDLIPVGAWGRVALTTEQISGTEWDGSGEFTRGEIEDFFVPDTDDCPRLLQVSFDRNPPIYPQGGANGSIFIDNVHPADPSGATFTWVLTRLLGNININPAGPGNGEVGPGGTPCTPLPGTPRRFTIAWNSNNGNPTRYRVDLNNVAPRALAQEVLGQAEIVVGQSQHRIFPTFAEAYFVGIPHGLVKGFVDSSDGEPIFNATITADISLPPSVEAGFFSMLVQSGPRKVTVSAPGFKTAIIDVNVGEFETTRLHVVLERE